MNYYDLLQGIIQDEVRDYYFDEGRHPQLIDDIIDTLREDGGKLLEEVKSYLYKFLEEEIEDLDMCSECYGTLVLGGTNTLEHTDADGNRGTRLYYSECSECGNTEK